MNKLLIDDYPIQVLPSLAVQIGLNEAIILQQVHYWLNNSKHFHDGRKWIYNSYPQWKKQFPFWSEKTIKRTITSIEKQGLFHIGNYNRAGFDRTKWYSINYEAVNNLVSRPSGQNDPTSGSNWADGKGQNDPTNTRDYTETSPETTSLDNMSDSKESNVIVTKQQFNEWWNAYNKKIGRKKAEDKFRQCVKKHGFDAVMNGTRKYLATIKDKQFQKHPLTFLNGEHYNDEYETIVNPGQQLEDIQGGTLDEYEMYSRGVK
ncbi:replication protein [Macrococcus brunensis]|uniref:replication protein n=1 Tax=Macrococcus brunensis TaxID=198483 RepID=UPI001EF09697|nr:replication protein [Macrococcus brunensis]ULG72988.1 replication protein [Macrococcus brunensis]